MNEGLKKNVAIISFGVIIVLLGIICYFVTTPERGGEYVQMEEERYFEIFSIQDENIKKIRIENGKEDITFVRAEKVEKSASGKDVITHIYEYPKNSEILLSQAKIKNMLYDFYEFNVKKVVSEDMTKKGDYGFNENSPKVTITDINDVETVFVLGDKTSVDESYYVMKEGEDKIYLMSGHKAGSFINEFNSYRETVLGKMNSFTPISFSITNKGVRALGIRYKMENDKEVVTIDNTTYVMLVPHNGIVRIDRFSELMENFGDVVVQDFVEDNPQDLSKYGLDNPVKAVIQDIEKNAHEMFFGNYDEKGNVYTMYENNDVKYNMVFTTTPEMYEAVKDVDPFDLLEKFANLYNILEVSDIRISTAEGLAFDLNIREEADKYIYKINGKDAIEKGFKAVYQGIVGLVITSQAEEERKENVVCTIEFTFKDGRQKKTTIYEYDERNYGVMSAEGTYNLTLKKNVRNMIELLDDFDKNPQVTP